MLLEKDPKRRFQTPVELLKAMPTITGAIDEGRTITYQSPRKIPDAQFLLGYSQAASKTGPENFDSQITRYRKQMFLVERRISLSWIMRGPTTDVNVVIIVAWAGVGKSTLVNHWLGRMAAEHYRSAELVFGWSLYRQGTSGGTSSADEFLDAALTWFGDPDPRIGTAWEKGERLAKLVSHRQTLLVLDGLEPLQNPPGPQEGRLRDLPSRRFCASLLPLIWGFA